MFDRFAAAAPAFRDRSAAPGFGRHGVAGTTLAVWIIVFAMAALMAAWLGGAWTPPDKPVPGASWFVP